MAVAPPSAVACGSGMLKAATGSRVPEAAAASASAECSNVCRRRAKGGGLGPSDDDVDTVTATGQPPFPPAGHVSERTPAR